MTLDDFKVLVQDNYQWFHGLPRETADTIADAERKLGVTLPPSLVWLLTEWGYSNSTACGLDGLHYGIDLTIELRTSINLPARYVVLNDWQNAGVVFMDIATPNPMGEYPIYWADSHDFARVASGEEMSDEVDIYPDFPSWVKSRLEDAFEFDPYNGRMYASGSF